MSLSTNWVLYRESPDSHDEIYFAGLLGDNIEASDEIGDALYFPSAATAYDFAGDKPALQWWKVGKR